MKGFTKYDACGHNHADDYGKYNNKFTYNGFSLSAVDALLTKYKNESWHAKFGLGMIQWTGDRTIKLMKYYHAEAGSSDTITYNQCMNAELKLLQAELFGSNYNYIYTNWKSKYGNSLNSADAAYNAGYRVCYDYERPSSKAEKSEMCANYAKQIYSITIG